MAEKRRNTNAYTEHSVKLRAESSAKAQRERLASGAIKRLELRGTAALIDKIKACLAKIDGDSQTEKVGQLVDFYEDNNK